MFHTVTVTDNNHIHCQRLYCRVTYYSQMIHITSIKIMYVIIHCHVRGFFPPLQCAIVVILGRIKKT